MIELATGTDLDGLLALSAPFSLYWLGLAVLWWLSVALMRLTLGPEFPESPLVVSRHAHSRWFAATVFAFPGLFIATAGSVAFPALIITSVWFTALAVRLAASRKRPDWTSSERAFLGLHLAFLLAALIAVGTAYVRAARPAYSVSLIARYGERETGHILRQRILAHGAESVTPLMAAARVAKDPSPYLTLLGEIGNEDARTKLEEFLVHEVARIASATSVESAPPQEEVKSAYRAYVACVGTATAAQRFPQIPPSYAR